MLVARSKSKISVIFAGLLFPLNLSSMGTGFPEKCWSHHPWKHSQNVWIWYLRTQFIGESGDGWTG